MHGIDLDKTIKKKPEPTLAGDDPIFRHPEAYKDMSREDREDLTQQMMKKLKGWASQSVLWS